MNVQQANAYNAAMIEFRVLYTIIGGARCSRIVYAPDAAAARHKVRGYHAGQTIRFRDVRVVHAYVRSAHDASKRQWLATGEGIGRDGESQ